jgi:hypothetical protein
MGFMIPLVLHVSCVCRVCCCLEAEAQRSGGVLRRRIEKAKEAQRQLEAEQIHATSGKVFTANLLCSSATQLYNTELGPLNSLFHAVGAVTYAAPRVGASRYGTERAHNVDLMIGDKYV